MGLSSLDGKLGIYWWHMNLSKLGLKYLILASDCKLDYESPISTSRLLSSISVFSQALSTVIVDDKYSVLSSQLKIHFKLKF